MMSFVKNLILGAGVLAVLAAYGLSMFEIISYQGDLFYILNFAGGLAVFIGNFFDRDSASFWSYVFLVWAIVTALVYLGVRIII